MAEGMNLLRGSCACERNQYEIELPRDSTSLASVFFDNSAQSRRPQASPVTAWLRIPLDYYHSFTVAQFPDETHTTIRRTYTTSRAARQTTRRQFCGYCGTHLTAYDESAQATSAELIDVTLGSLLDESLTRLETLNILPTSGEDNEEEQEQEEGLVMGGSVDNDTHIAPTAVQERKTEGGPQAGIRPWIRHHMQHRGMPYFEEMIENSSLGRIRRQKGGHLKDDGRTTVHWEIVEFNGDETMRDADTLPEGSPAKRLKLDA